MRIRRNSRAIGPTRKQEAVAPLTFLDHARTRASYCSEFWIRREKTSCESCVCAPRKNTLSARTTRAMGRLDGTDSTDAQTRRFQIARRTFRAINILRIRVCAEYATT